MHGENGAAAANEDDEEDEDDDDELYGEWTLRKCAAASLDVISNTFGNDILLHLLPALNKSLSSTEWKHQEAAILALGAIAEGNNYFNPYLI
jgi:transportin-1